MENAASIPRIAIPSMENALSIEEIAFSILGNPFTQHGDRALHPSDRDPFDGERPLHRRDRVLHPRGTRSPCMEIALSIPRIAIPSMENAISIEEIAFSIQGN